MSEIRPGYHRVEIGEDPQPDDVDLAGGVAGVIRDGQLYHVDDVGRQFGVDLADIEEWFADAPEHLPPGTE